MLRGPTATQVWFAGKRDRVARSLRLKGSKLRQLNPGSEMVPTRTFIVPLLTPVKAFQPRRSLGGRRPLYGQVVDTFCILALHNVMVLQVF